MQKTSIFDVVGEHYHVYRNLISSDPQQSVPPSPTIPNWEWSSSSVVPCCDITVQFLSSLSFSLLFIHYVEFSSCGTWRWDWVTGQVAKCFQDGSCLHCQSLGSLSGCLESCIGCGVMGWGFTGVLLWKIKVQTSDNRGKWKGNRTSRKCFSTFHLNTVNFGMVWYCVWF